MMSHWKHEVSNTGLSLFLDTQNGLFAGGGGVVMLGFWVGFLCVCLGCFHLPLLWISHRRHYFPSYFSAGV